MKSPGVASKHPAWELVAKEIGDNVISSLHSSCPKKLEAKPLVDFSVQEVCTAVETLELDSSQFRANAVDGQSLIELTDKEMKSELKLRPLQIKKLKRFIGNSS